MNQKLWAKTLLHSYNCLENIANAIDTMVINQGVSSMNNRLSTEENAEKIIRLIKRKKLLINLKVLINNIMSKLDTDSARILVLKYFDKLKTEVCLEVMNLPRRTFFRKADKALEEFGTMLKIYGYDECTIHSLICEENWIKEIYNGYKNQEPKISKKSNGNNHNFGESYDEIYTFNIKTKLGKVVC